MTNNINKDDAIIIEFCKRCGSKKAYSSFQQKSICPYCLIVALDVSHATLKETIRQQKTINKINLAFYAVGAIIIAIASYLTFFY